MFNPIGERDGDHLSRFKPTVPQAGGKPVDLIRESAITNLCPIVGQNDGGLPFVCVDEEIRKGLHGYLLVYRLDHAGLERKDGHPDPTIPECLHGLRQLRCLETVAATAAPRPARWFRSR